VRKPKPHEVPREFIRHAAGTQLLAELRKIEPRALKWFIDSIAPLAESPDDECSKLVALIAVLVTATALDGRALCCCDQHGCTERAVYRYTWPGQGESFVCEEHSAKLREVASAIGLALELHTLN
jgi:hypothetical protein